MRAKGCVTVVSQVAGVSAGERRPGSNPGRSPACATGTVRTNSAAVQNATRKTDRTDATETLLVDLVRTPFGGSFTDSPNHASVHPPSGAARSLARVISGARPQAIRARGRSSARGDCGDPNQPDGERACR